MFRGANRQGSLCRKLQWFVRRKAEKYGEVLTKLKVSKRVEERERESKKRGARKDGVYQERSERAFCQNKLVRENVWTRRKTRERRKSEQTTTERRKETNRQQRKKESISKFLLVLPVYLFKKLNTGLQVHTFIARGQLGRGLKKMQKISEKFAGNSSFFSAPECLSKFVYYRNR